MQSRFRAGFGSLGGFLFLLTASGVSAQQAPETPREPVDEKLIKDATRRNGAEHVIDVDGESADPDTAVTVNLYQYMTMTKVDTETTYSDSYGDWGEDVEDTTATVWHLVEALNGTTMDTEMVSPHSASKTTSGPKPQNLPQAQLNGSHQISFGTDLSSFEPSEKYARAEVGLFWIDPNVVDNLNKKFRTRFVKCVRVEARDSGSGTWAWDPVQPLILPIPKQNYLLRIRAHDESSGQDRLFLRVFIGDPNHDVPDWRF